MKKFFLLIIFVVLFFNSAFAEDIDSSGVAASEPAEQDEPEAKVVSLVKGMQGKVSLDLRSIEIVDALKFLAMKAGLNIIYTRKVSGRVSLMVEDVRVQDIFDIMLRSNELAYTKQGGIYNVMTEDEYKALFGKKFSDLRQVKSFRLRYAIPEQAFALFDTLKSDIGRVLVEPDSGTVTIMDTPDSIEVIQAALVAMEKKNLVRVFNLKYARAKDVEEKLKLQLDAKKVGSIRADERSNQLIVQALPDRMYEIETLIEALDGKTKQVLIDAKVIKVKLSDSLSTGVEWEGLFDISARFGSTYFGSYPFTAVQGARDALSPREFIIDDEDTHADEYPFSGYSSTTKTVPGENMHVGIMGNRRDFDAVINYLQTLGDTRILSNPKLAVINNQEARIHVGERQAYVTTTTTTGQSTSTVSEEVTFVDIGLQLSVTPTINDDGYVTMKIKPEISSVTSTLTTPSGNKIPIIDTSTAETTVLVKDGSTIIIGGLRKEEEITSSEQVPFFGSIPIIGNIFKSSTQTTARTELLVMITPYIVSGDTLTTGDERDFVTVGKEYKGYESFTKETDYKAPVGSPETRIKSYREYGGIQRNN